MSPPGRAVRHRSRRRLAALAFLSNISLDGTYRDTKISGLGARRPLGGDCADNEEDRHGPAAVVDSAKATTDTVDAVEAAAPSAAPPPEALPPPSTPTVAPLASSMTALKVSSVPPPPLPPPPPHSRLRRQRSVDSGDIHRDRSVSEGAAPQRERCQTVGGESDNIIRRLVQTANIGSLLDDMLGHGGSSCESVCGSVRSNRLCSSVSEVSAPSGPAVRFVQPVRERVWYGDDRMVLVGRARLPVVVHSTLGLGRGSRHARRERHERGDLTARRRYNSGSRPPLSTISDRVDAFSLLGMDPLPEGQEVSFSQLLHPSTPSGGRTRRLHSVEKETDVAAAIHQRNQQQIHFNRCLSYDPQSVGKRALELAPTGSCDKVLEEEPVGEASATPYDPLLLDNPETQSENHRTVLNFRSYRSSIIDYMKPSDLKRVANDQFREEFPHIQLTLSKMRSLKRDMRRIAADCRIDLLSVAQAHVYFEKLVLRGLIDKPNRKLAAGACLLLAAKMNDVKGETMSQLVERTETVFRIQRRELLNCEFGALVALEFALHLPASEVEPHLRRLEA